MTKFSEYLQDKSDSRNLERSQKEVERLGKLSKQTAESVEASYIAEERFKTSLSITLCNFMK